MRDLTSPLKSEDGVALILTLWLMVFLIIIATQLSLSVKTELQVVSNYVTEAQCYYLAKAGVAQAVAEIMNPDNKYCYIDTRTKKLIFGRKNKNNDMSTDDKYDRISPGKDDMAFGNGLISYTIEDESGKIPLNVISVNTVTAKKIFSSLLESVGMKEGVERDTIVESAIDWVDKDDLHQLNGAEDDYYQGLDPPYDCKNGRFDLLEELLLVQGVKRSIYDKLHPLITVFVNGRGAFNENTASCSAYKIWRAPQDVNNRKPAQTQDDECAARFDENGVPKNKKLSTVFTIVSTGTSKDGFIKRTVKAVVKRFISGKNKMSFRFLFWDDNFFPLEKDKKR